VDSADEDGKVGVHHGRAFNSIEKNFQKSSQDSQRSLCRERTEESSNLKKSKQSFIRAKSKPHHEFGAFV
jgi:hypothetical protein